MMPLPRTALVFKLCDDPRIATWASFVNRGGMVGMVTPDCPLNQTPANLEWKQALEDEEEEEDSSFPFSSFLREEFMSDQ
jgi:hypothetical protein